MSSSVLRRLFQISSFLLYVIPSCVPNHCDSRFDSNILVRTNSVVTERSLVKHVCQVDSFPIYLDDKAPSINYDVVYIKVINIRAIPDKAFQNNSQYIKYGEIHIENQHLEEIASSAFESLNYLREIHLSMNDLTNIKDRTFSITSLEILDLSMNKIQHFGHFALIESSNLRLLNLSSNSLKVFDLLQSISLPHLNLDLSFNEFTSFQFENTSGNVEKLNLSHNSLTEVKDCFPAFSVINLSNNNLRSISNVSCFSSAEGRIMINLGSNSLSEFNSGIFDKMSNLKYLYLDLNNLTSFSTKIFRRLYSLELLSISGNHLKNVGDDLFENLESLLSLDLSFNGLSQLPSGIFDNLSNLKYLYLDQNNLTSFPTKIFARQHSLELLNISGNHLKNLGNDLFENLESLLSLDLSFNGLSQLPSGIFDNLSNLKYLYLDQNNLTSFPTKIFARQHSLELLNISGNHLKNVGNDLFENLESLLSLNLSFNELSQLQSGVFDKMSNLKYLYLDNNNLTTFPNDIFAGLVSLKLLNISHNHLRKFQYGLFDPLVNLISLDLSYNQIIDIKNLQHSLQKLENFNVEFNRLKQIKFSLADLHHLRKIIMDGNEFSCKTLPELFHILDFRGVVVTHGHSRAVDNIRGIRCYEDDSFSTESVLGSDDEERFGKTSSQKSGEYMNITLSIRELLNTNLKQFISIGTIIVVFLVILILLSAFISFIKFKMYVSSFKHTYTSHEQVELCN